MSTRIARILVVLAFLAAERAAACACCTNRGERSISTKPMVDYQRSILNALAFKPEARLHMTEAGYESIRGIEGPSETYALVVSRGTKAWSFAFASDNGGRGTLDLAIPGSIDVFEVDPRDELAQGSGPVLYKEWRLFSKLSGTGIFARATGPQVSLSLILHGRGRGCPSEGDFHAWTLVARGPNVSFTLLGEFVRPQ